MLSHSLHFHISFFEILFSAFLSHFLTFTFLFHLSFNLSILFSQMLITFYFSGGQSKEQSKKPLILAVAPHTAPFDFLCGIVLGSPSPVAKIETAKAPLFGS